MDCLAKESRRIGDNWELRTVTNPCGEIDRFLSKIERKVIQLNNGDDNDDYHDDLSSEPLESEAEMNDMSVTVCYKRYCTVEYNIIYSRSYSVPVLYMIPQTLDGCMLNIEELIELCSPQHKDYMHSHLWSTLTQVEHPIHQTVCYMLHPCKTSQLMGQLPSSKAGLVAHYLIQWLSSIGPAVGLHLPIDYAVCCE